LSDSSNELKVEEAAYLKMYGWLKEKYPGKYIAFHYQEMVDQDTSLDKLSAQIYEKFGNTPVGGDKAITQMILGGNVLNHFVITLNGLANVVQISQGI
jgi:hypothetical protein